MVVFAAQEMLTEGAKDLFWTKFKSKSSILYDFCAYNMCYVAKKTYFCTHIIIRAQGIIVPTRL